MEIALDIQRGIKNRLSVQYLNSCYDTGADYACCGGWLEDVADFYSRSGYQKAIPWANTNASWQDGAKQCPPDGISGRTCGTISTTTQYPIYSVTATTISTHGVGQAAAINNIKNVLNQNKAVSFSFFLCNDVDWQVFFDFWDDQAESALFDFDYSCSKPYTDDGGGHSVLCVGYNDDNPSNRYWIMVNSWGTTASRTNGIFRVSMDIDYDCHDTSPDYNLYWQTLDIDFSGASTFGESMIDSGDYNGDGITDIAIFRPSSGMWSVRNVTRVYLGNSTDLPAAADYNNDDKTDIAIFRPSTGMWSVRNITRIYMGSTGDIPVPGDYSGDSVPDYAVFRPSSGLWSVRNVTRVYLGSSGDLPVPGYYGTGAAKKTAIFRPASALWSVRGRTRCYFGSLGDKPAVANFNGDEYDDIAVFRPSTGMWSVRNITRVYSGSSLDRAVPGYYNNDARADFGTFRPSSGLWAVRNLTRVYFGAATDLPATK